MKIEIESKNILDRDLKKFPNQLFFDARLMTQFPLTYPWFFLFTSPRYPGPGTW
jgi:hypothetical protein